MSDTFDDELRAQLQEAMPTLVLDDEPPTTLVEILPADFPLSALIKFVPDARLKVELDDATAALLRVAVTGRDGLERAAAAQLRVRDHLERVRQNFDEPKRLAYQLHAHITGAFADATNAAEAAVKAVGQTIWVEKRRLDQIDAEARRTEQADADALERARLGREADEAEASAAPATVVGILRAQAIYATAPPVPAPATKPPSSVSTVTNWKARPAGTPPTADPNPAVADLSLAQRAGLLALLADIVETKRNLTCIDINWTVLNARAKAERSAFAVPGFEAFETGTARAKRPTRTT
jgi:hypothetical protein